MSYVAGDRVRVRSDPGRVGVVTGLSRPRLSLDYFQVAFPDGKAFVPEDQLELIRDGVGDPLAGFLEQARFATCGDLRRALVHVRLTGRLADIIYSMETTDTTFYAYQFKPV